MKYIKKAMALGCKIKVEGTYLVFKKFPKGSEDSKGFICELRELGAEFQRSIMRYTISSNVKATELESKIKEIEFEIEADRAAGLDIYKEDKYKLETIKVITEHKKVFDSADESKTKEIEGLTLEQMMHIDRQNAREFKILCDTMDKINMTKTLKSDS